MKFCSLVSLISGLLFSASIQAQIVDLEITEENICQQLIKQRKSHSLNDKFEDLKDSLEILFRKSDLGKPEISQIETKSSRTNSCLKITGKNYIVSLGVDSSNEISQSELEYQIRTYEELNKKIENQTKILFRMSSSFTVPLCEMRKKFYKFSWQEYQRNLEEKKSLIWGKRHLEFLEVKKIVENEIAKNLKLDWTFVKDSTLESVYSLLKNQDTRHVILINHGRDGGEIFDGNEASYPPTFFNSISSSLESLALFACHSHEAINYYNLSEIFSQPSSSFRERTIFSVKPNQLQHEKNVALLSSLKFFIRNIDNYIADYKCGKEIHVSPQDPSQICRLESRNLILRRGTLGISLNGQFIGAATAPKEQISIEFNCSLLNDKESNFVFSNLRMQESENATLDNNDFDIELTSLSKEKPIIISNKKTVLTDNNLFRKRIFKVKFEDSL